ncbi:MAG: hypothetical protein AAFQ94_00420 [Bacteroidota bacterium]
MKSRGNYKLIGLLAGVVAGAIAGWFLGIYPFFVALGGSIGIGVGSSLASRK